jgi:hypothetical protein
MKRRMQKILAIVLTAGMAFSGVSAEASGDLVLLHAVADTTSSSGVTGDTVEAVREDGKEGSAEKRKKVLRQIDLPEHMSADAMLDVLNALMDREEFFELMLEHPL